ncbi:MAG TPA: DUF2934 domain-containing protein [Rhodocyclaceae bacterium]|nr:DUF2934 domain-containing protein [Rhodocyclaceae bacterium]
MMAKNPSTSLTPKGRAKLPSEGPNSPGQRERMIREAAYFRYLQRGAVLGHDLDDWLVAEAELFSGESEQQPPEEDETTELDVQGSGVHSFWEDDALKRIIRQHPRKGIPQVEGVEAQEAPLKE